MRDLENNAVRGAAGGGVSSAAISKLKTLSNSGVTVGATDGLVDAFAEVFARMSVATPAASNNADSSVVEPEADVRDGVTQTELSEREETSQDERIDQVEPEVFADPLLQVVAPESDVNETFVDRHEQTDSDVVSIESEINDDPDEPIVSVTAITIVTTNDAVFESALPVTESIGGVNADPADAVPPTSPEPAELKQTELEPAELERTVKSGGEPAETDTQVSSAASTTIATATDGGENQSSRRDRRRERGSDQANSPANANAATPIQNAKAESASSTGFAIPVQSGADPQSVESVTPELQQKVEAALNVTAAIAAKTQSSVAAAAARTSQRSDAIAQVRGTTSTSMSVDPAAGSRAEMAARLDQPKKSDAGRETQQADLMTRIKLVQRVSKAFQHLGADGGVVRLRLAPAELGTVRIEMRMQQKKIEARVVADTEAAGAALREHLPDLRARLEAFGMQVEKIDVDVEPFHLGDDGGSNGQSNFDDASSQRQRPDRSAMAMADDRGRVSRSESVIVPKPLSWTTAAGGVDVRI